MNIIDRINRFLAVREFNNTREGFYEDLAEALNDQETIKIFLTKTKDHLERTGQSRKALVYEEMLDKLLESGSWKLSTMLDGIVPQSDMLMLLANDNAAKEEDQVEGFMFLASTLRNMRELKSTVMMSMLTPMLVLPVMLIFVFIIAYLFMPENEKILSHDHWGKYEQLLYWFSYGLRNYWAAIGVGAVALVITYIRSFANWKGELRSKFEMIPIIGTPHLIYRDYQASTFITALAAMLKSKKDLVSAIEMLMESSGKWMAWHLQSILENLTEHPDDVVGAFNTGLLSPALHLRLSNFARRNNFHAGLMRLGTEGLKYVEKEVKTSSIKLNVASLLLTVFVIVGLYGTNLSITNTITRYMKESVQ